ncbi:MAG: Ig-like domain-containing protein [Bacteriovoracia bacterium]
MFSFGNRKSMRLFKTLALICALMGMGSSCLLTTANQHLGKLPGSGVDLVSIEVDPPVLALAKGMKQAITVIGYDKEGNKYNVTQLANWASLKEVIAEVENQGVDVGVVKAMDKGSVVITVSYKDLEAELPVDVSDAELSRIEISPSIVSVAKGMSQKLVATGVFTDDTTQDLSGDVKWTSSASAVTIDAKGVLAGADVGGAKIKAALNGVEAAAEAVITSASLSSLEISPTNPSAPVGVAQSFVATGIFSDGSKQDLTKSVKWASAEAKFASVDSSGGALGISAGSSAISIQYESGDGSILDAKTSFAVTAAELVSLTVSPDKGSIAAGLTQQFSAMGSYTDGTQKDVSASVTWSASDKNVLAISNGKGTEGLATSLQAGVTEVQAQMNGFGGMVTGKIDFTVSAAELVSIDIKPASLALAKGLTQSFFATGNYTDGSVNDITTDVVWDSSDAKVAAVSNGKGEQGLASALSAGQVTVTASLNGIDAKAAMETTAAELVSIAVSPNNASLVTGETGVYTATGTYTDGSTEDLSASAVWASSDTKYATLSNGKGSEGVATGVAKGNVVVSATLKGVSGSADLAILAPSLKSIAVTPANSSVSVGGKLQYVATGTYSNGSTADITASVAWTATAGSKGASATISASGLLTGGTAGQVIVSATAEEIGGSTNLTVSSK